jgi:uncharacterized protein (UPF0335 family)
MTIGHNSKTTKAGPIHGERLKSFVERIEKMEAERKAICGDIRDIYAEAKGVGYDVKTVRWVVQERRMEASDRAERDTLRDVYQHALDTAVGLVRGGLSLREAGRVTGLSKSSIHRALSVPEVSQPAGPKPEDGDDGITETAVPGDGPKTAVSNVGGDNDAGLKTQGEEVARVAPPDSCTDEAPATPSVGEPVFETDDEVAAATGVGAGGPSSGRVAPPEDDLEIPAHLRGPSPANRSLRP